MFVESESKDSQCFNIGLFLELGRLWVSVDLDGSPAKRPLHSNAQA